MSVSRAFFCLGINYLPHNPKLALLGQKVNPVGAEDLSIVQVRKCGSRTSDSSGHGGLAVQTPFTARQGVRIHQTATPAASKQSKELLKVTKRIIRKSLKFFLLFKVWKNYSSLQLESKFKVLKSVCGSVS